MDIKNGEPAYGCSWRSSKNTKTSKYNHNGKKYCLFN